MGRPLSLSHARDDVPGNRAIRVGARLPAELWQVSGMSLLPLQASAYGENEKETSCDLLFGDERINLCRFYTARARVISEVPPAAYSIILPSTTGGANSCLIKSIHVKWTGAGWYAMDVGT